MKILPQKRLKKILKWYMCGWFKVLKPERLVDLRKNRMNSLKETENKFKIHKFRKY